MKSRDVPCISVRCLGRMKSPQTQRLVAFLASFVRSSHIPFMIKLNVTSLNAWNTLSLTRSPSISTVAGHWFQAMAGLSRHDAGL